MRAAGRRASKARSQVNAGDPAQCGGEHPDRAMVANDQIGPAQREQRSPRGRQSTQIIDPAEPDVVQQLGIGVNRVDRAGRRPIEMRRRHKLNASLPLPLGEGRGEGGRNTAKRMSGVLQFTHRGDHPMPPHDQRLGQRRKSQQMPQPAPELPCVKNRCHRAAGRQVRNRPFTNYCSTIGSSRDTPGSAFSILSIESGRKQGFPRSLIDLTKKERKRERKRGQNGSVENSSC